MDTNDKIDIACVIFESIKQNWLKSGDFNSLMNIVCAGLEIVPNDEIKEKLKKSQALWLSNHLDEPLDDDSEAEVIDEKPKKQKQKQNHDYH